MRRFLAWFTNLYVLWLILDVIVSLIYPATFLWFTGQWIVMALSIVMLGMGFTLSIDDFRRIFVMPGSIAIGFVAQYTVMPLSGWFIAWALDLDPGFAAGLILVAACPGGTASNVITYLARANVALSVVLTMASTLLAFIMTPLWTKMLAGQYVPVDPLALCLSTLKVIVIPVLIGVFCNWRFPRAVARISEYGPLVSVVAIIFITGGVVSSNAAAVRVNLGVLTLATFLLHVLGFGFGYGLSRVLRYPVDVARTVSIEVGMQNGGMAAVLAKQHFTSHPLAAVPAAFSAVMQNLLGSILAAYWRARPVDATPVPELPLVPAKVPVDT